MPFSPRLREPITRPADLGAFHLLCVGGTVEGFAAAGEACALGAKVCVVEPFSVLDGRAVFRLALRSCLRRALSVGLPGLLSSSFEELRRERDVQVERLAVSRRSAVKRGVVVMTCNSATLAAAGPAAHVGNGAKASKSAASFGGTTCASTCDGSIGESPRVDNNCSGGSAEVTQQTPRASWRSASGGPGAAAWRCKQRLPEPYASEPDRDRATMRVSLSGAMPPGRYAEVKTGCCWADHCLLAAGEPALLQGACAGDGLGGRELCTQPEDLLEALPLQGPQRICVIGTCITAAELVTFCELSGAETTWLLDAADLRQTQAFFADMLSRLVCQFKSRGGTTLHTDINTRMLRVVQREDLSEPSQAAKSACLENRISQTERLLYLQAKHSGADCLGPFHTVVLFGKAEACVLGVDALPGVQTVRGGQLLVNHAGTACPGLWAVGELATLSVHHPRSLAGLGAFGNDEEGLISQGRHVAQILFGSGVGPPAPPVRLTTVLTDPPVGLVGLSGHEAEAAFDPLDWKVSTSYSRHRLLGSVCGYFVIGLVCVEGGRRCTLTCSEGLQDTPLVVGATIFAERGGLPLLSGLLLGLAVAIHGGVPRPHFEQILAAYPLADEESS